MGAVTAHELRDHTAAVLRRVSSGETIEVLDDNEPVARIIPIRNMRRWIPGREVALAMKRIEQGTDSEVIDGEPPKSTDR